MATIKRELKSILNFNSLLASIELETRNLSNFEYLVD